ncbi:MAG: dihydroorotate dehydrogenase [Mycoplasmataceae bacterium]|jgi:dihydroorotate dehydrogenase (NAD+) catalytic subunit|nr:dihydroorotate dehydrogenase [Mycoplasmataceae bacterium]
MVKKTLQVNLGNWILDNPLIPASGTFGYGLEHQQYYDINKLGSFAFKGTTLLPRYGNELPRIAEFNHGMINAVGLQNPGVDHVIKQELTSLKKFYKKQVIANVAATTIEDFVTIVKKLNKENIVAIYEINVSCPNVDKGAMKFDCNPNDLEKLIKSLKPVAQKPIYIKLSPRVSDIVLMATTAEKAGADGLVLINTVPGMSIDINTRRPLLGNKVGGCSGSAIKPIALRSVYLCYQAVKIPIIGCGGVMNSEDLIEMMMAGASAVEIGTANLIDPYACLNILNDLPNAMKKYNIKDIKDIIGVAHAK